jgi:predicted transcriptional regulator
MDNLISITIEVPARVMKRLEELAKEQNKTVSQVAREILEAVALKDNSK